MAGKILFALALCGAVRGAFCEYEERVRGSFGDEGGPVATSPTGKFLGTVMKSRRGRTFHSFRGIRYAVPPTGENRFQPPILITDYKEQLGTEEVNATADGPACPQPGNYFDPPSEDCLILNVYSNNIHAAERGLLPVLVYYHPGGFYSVSSQSFLEGPSYLLDFDVVVVTVNYRLGTLGYISTGDKYAPGNLGFKDQVASLRWIQQNIASFGGDPGQVTIWGYSAGAMSVTLHMVSPMSKGLFHRAISMSATGTAQWAMPLHQFDLAQKQARLVGCPSYNSSREIVECLQTVDANLLGNSLSGFFEFGDQSPVLIWKPVIEQDFGQERFLTDDPVKLIQQGQFHDVPLIIGQCELEFAYQAFTLLLNETTAREMDKNWNSVAPIAFQYERNTSRSLEASQKFRDFYMGDREFVFSNETAFALGRLYADSVIGYSVHRFANLMANHLKSPLYYYKFNYTATQSHFYYPNTTTPIGAVHHDDLLSLWAGSRYFSPVPLNSVDSPMVDKMTTMWTNFAIRGDPNPVDGQPILDDLEWPVMTAHERQYLQINQDQFVVERNMFDDRYSLWDSIFFIDYTK